MILKTHSFGQTSEGQAVSLYAMQNDHGHVVTITNYGGIMVSWLTPDRHGRLDDVLLGFESLEGFLGAHPCFGALIGRYANRIANGKFTLDGVEYALACNNGANHLHGGLKGFDKVVWDAKEITSADRIGVELRYLSRDGEEGYPGNLSVTVAYTFANDNAVTIDYAAATDRATVVNLTNHAYFNLLGVTSGRDVLRHELTMHADYFTPVDRNLIPTGELRSVKGTPLDFTSPTAIGARIQQDDEQLRLGGGYDHNFVVNRKGAGLALAARVHEPTTGRTLEVETTEPGVQLYTSNFLGSSMIRGKGNVFYENRTGFCLEAQHFPDSPNHPSFPTTVLLPGETYRQTTIYRCSTQA